MGAGVPHLTHCLLSCLFFPACLPLPSLPYASPLLPSLSLPAHAAFALFAHHTLFETFTPLHTHTVLFVWFTRCHLVAGFITTVMPCHEATILVVAVARPFCMTFPFVWCAPVSLRRGHLLNGKRQKAIVTEYIYMSHLHLQFSVQWGSGKNRKKKREEENEKDIQPLCQLDLLCLSVTLK